RARVVERLAVRPAPGRAVDPVDNIVADVERVDSFRQDLGTERILEARCVERLVPPADAFAQRAAHRLWSGAVNVEDDWLLDRRARRRRIGLFEPEAVGDV